jgi:ribonuclease PH
MMNRRDGRSENDLRPVNLTLHYIDHFPSSVLIEIGKTQVLCAATVDEKVPHFLKDTGSGWITAEYSMLPYSCKERVQRESVKGKLTGRTQEIQRIIGRSLRGVVNLQLLGERTIIVDADVICADGGTRCASITGGFCALYLAVKELIERNIIKKNPITDFVAAISSGIVQGRALLDLTYDEDSQASCDLNLVMTSEKKIVEIQTTAEGIPFSFDTLNRLLSLAKEGVTKLIEEQKKVLPKL